VFAHIYHAQFPYLIHLCCEGHFNSLFAHFIAFGAEFELFSFQEVSAIAAHYPHKRYMSAHSSPYSLASLPQFKNSGNSTGGGYPGVCDLIEAWVQMGILEEKCLK
jgi:MOB kinase activator 1